MKDLKKPEAAHSISVQVAPVGVNTVTCSQLKPNTRYSCMLVEEHKGVYKGISDTVHFVTSYAGKLTNCVCQVIDQSTFH